MGIAKTEKLCKRCDTHKDINSFRVNKNRVENVCKECATQRLNEWRKSKEGVVSTIYSSQILSCKKRGHDAPSYSKEELMEFMLSSEIFHAMYDEWCGDGYTSNMKPSIDRVDNSIGYTMSNIQIMTWGDNDQKGRDDMRSGVLIHGNNPQKKVARYTKEGKYVDEFVSTSDAGRKTGVSQSHISDATNNKRKSAGGFLWKSV